MSNWFSKNLGDALLSTQSLDDIKDMFITHYEKAGKPRNMALFIRHESEGRLHCEVVVYFSPASSIVAQAVDASSCNKPLHDDLSLLAGSEDSWLELFPEK